MLDISNSVLYKLSLNIRCTNLPDNRNIVDYIKRILFSEIDIISQQSADWKAFSFGGTYVSTDHSVFITSAIISKEDGFPLWSATISLRDSCFSRRSWKYYFGIDQRSNTEVYFCYTKCYYDHLTGSLVSPKPVYIYRDTFPDCLLYESCLQFPCGKYDLSMVPIELTTTNLNTAQDCILDPERTLPFMLITCPDVIAPEKIQDIVTGNMFVWWCSDQAVINQLNSLLPHEMRTSWDSVRVFMPVSCSSVFHPIYPYEVIHRMGIETFYNGIRQAYCQSFRNDERKQFITVADVMRYREQILTNRLLQQVEQQRNEISNLTQQLAQCTALLKNAESKLIEYSPEKIEAQISEYESLLTQTFSEVDSLKEGVEALSAQLYSTMGITFRPDQCASIPILQELSHAIYSALACVGTKSNKRSSSER